ncbi:hypothetical protein E2C01_060773 [Portunus trituberculatus]|uniref:Uncharacterized protein n=1 Tax=Portunus trituberculatus TaxID=210409 RepID=A0A5B7H917_PORTR|nr:hypothetical protein [Portunus trituberculatus]
MNVRVKYDGMGACGWLGIASRFKCCSGIKQQSTATQGSETVRAMRVDTGVGVERGHTAPATTTTTTTPFSRLKRQTQQLPDALLANPPVPWRQVSGKYSPKGLPQVKEE